MSKEWAGTHRRVDSVEHEQHRRMTVRLGKSFQNLFNGLPIACDFRQISATVLVAVWLFVRHHAYFDSPLIGLSRDSSCE